MPPASRTVAHVAPVVRPAARLLEPADVQIPDALAEIERHAGGVALVGVDGDHEVVAGHLAHHACAGRVLGGRSRSELELAAAEAHLEPLLDLAADLVGRPVVAADDVDGQAVAVAAPELEERATQRASDRVPDRRVDAGERDEADAPIAKLIERDRIAELPAALDRERVLTDQARLDLGLHDVHDLLERRVLVGRVGLADDALVGMDAREDRRPVGHGVVAAAVLAAERHDDRDHLDAPDGQAIGSGRPRARVGCGVSAHGIDSDYRDTCPAASRRRLIAQARVRGARKSDGIERLTGEPPSKRSSSRPAAARPISADWR